MKNRRFQAFPVDSWKIQGTTFTESESGDRKIAEYLIGTATVGDETQAIYERIFVDVYNMILQKKVKLHLNLYSDPVIVCERNGKLVPHSPDDLILREDIDDVIDVSTEANRIRALTEIRRNLYNASYLGDCTRNLREQITNALPEGYFADNKPLSYDFLKLYLREKYRMNDMPKEGTLQEIIRDYSKEQLIELYGGMLEYAKCGGASYSPMKDLLAAKHEPGDIEATFFDELTRRFFLGEIS